ARQVPRIAPIIEDLFGRALDDYVRLHAAAVAYGTCVDRAVAADGAVQQSACRHADQAAVARGPLRGESDHATRGRREPPFPRREIAGAAVTAGRGGGYGHKLSPQYGIRTW